MTFVAFIIERLLVSVPDVLLTGGGAFLLFNRGKAYQVGICLLLVYALSFLGTLWGPNPPSLNAGNAEADAFFSFSIGLIAGLIGAFWGKKRRKKRSGQGGQTSQ